MKVKDVRLHLVTNDDFQSMRLLDQEDGRVCAVAWGKHVKRTKAQAWAIAMRLCDRFNAGQEKKPCSE